jgi:hypothetical protein
MSEEGEVLGLNLRATRIKLNELLIERSKVKNEMTTLVIETGRDEIKREKLADKLEVIERQIIQTREWYNTVLTDSLYHESKRLNNLTTVLIGLTAALSVFTVIDFLTRIIHV